MTEAGSKSLSPPRSRHDLRRRSSNVQTRGRCRIFQRHRDLAGQAIGQASTRIRGPPIPLVTVRTSFAAMSSLRFATRAEVQRGAGVHRLRQGRPHPSERGKRPGRDDRGAAPFRRTLRVAGSTSPLPATARSRPARPARVWSRPHGDSTQAPFASARRRGFCGATRRPTAASVLQASTFRGDVTVFRLNATAVGQSGSEACV